MSKVHSGYSKAKRSLISAFEKVAKPVRKRRYIDSKSSRWSGPIPELKFFDTAVSFTADATNEIPATGQLCAIAQGDTQSNREGRKITVKSLLFTGSVNFAPGASANASTLVTIWVVQDTQCNGAAATVADDNTGIFTAAGSTASNAVRCLANVDRFRILKKWQFTLTAQAGVTTAYNSVTKPMYWYKKCNIPIEYDASATTGALSTIRSNNIFLVAGSQQTDDLVTVEGTFRLRFVG